MRMAWRRFGNNRLNSERGARDRLAALKQLSFARLRKEAAVAASFLDITNSRESPDSGGNAAQTPANARRIHAARSRSGPTVLV